ncbi:uncharacterized protein V1510DRAFT_401387 [Dipodascopsis tothii]|uniref:uncharacterized protein n=1 Tax=Dipodascopsis tothii TaxID=44089 RepID=UPI0034CF96C5
MASLWDRYNRLPLTARLWIGASTMLTAYIGMVASDKMYEAEQAKKPAPPPQA